MTKILKLSCCAFLFWSICASAQAPLSTEGQFVFKPFTANYSAKIKKGITLDGKATRHLNRLDDKRWEYIFEVKSLPVDLNESAVIVWDGSRIQPKSYNYELTGVLIRDKIRRIKFDWSKQIAKGDQGKQGWEIDIPDLALDRLSYQMQLVADIAQKRTPLHYKVVHKGRIEESNFRILKEEVINTRLGKMESRLVEKIRAPERPRKTLLWFSKSQPLLLLKMYQLEKNGEEYEIELQSVSYHEK